MEQTPNRRLSRILPCFIPVPGAGAGAMSCVPSSDMNLLVHVRWTRKPVCWRALVAIRAFVVLGERLFAVFLWVFCSFRRTADEIR